MRCQVSEKRGLCPTTAAPTTQPKNSLIDVILEDQARPLEQLRAAAMGMKLSRLGGGWSRPAEKKPGLIPFPGLSKYEGVYP